MLIHSAVITGSVQLNNTDVSGITNVAGFATTASVNSLVVRTGSYATTSSVNDLQSVTGSYTTTSSFGAYTSSNDSTNTTQNTRLSTIESVTGSYATTGSNQFNGNQSISGSIVSNGTITAQTLVVQTVTSSIEFITGSTRNGSLSSNTHQFTGSVGITGSATTLLSVNNSVLFVSASGNVGIGTTSPNQVLHVRKNGTTTGINIDCENTSYQATLYYSRGGVGKWETGMTSTNEDWYLYGSDWTIYAKRSNGNVSIGNTQGNSRLTVSETTTGNPSREFNIDTATSGMIRIFSYDRNSGGIPLSINSPGGNVLIGTTSDNGYKLRVSGGIYAGNLYLQQAQASGGGTLTLANNDPSPDSGTVIGQVNFYNTDADIPGVAAYMRAYTGASFGVGGQLGFGTQNTWSSGTLNQRMFIDNAGNIGAPSGTNIYNASDRRLKRNISSIENGLSKVMALNPVKFNWIEKFVESEENKDMLGFIAQELLPHIPEAVESFGESDLHINGAIIENPLRVNEKFIIPVLVKAIQEQQAQIEELKTLINS